MDFKETGSKIVNVIVVIAIVLAIVIALVTLLSPGISVM